MPFIGGGKFESIGNKIRLPDDVTMGYAVEHLLQVPLTVVKEFHSHMEPQRLLPNDDSLSDGISFSYSSQDDQPDQSNVMNINQGFSVDQDPTRYVNKTMLSVISTINMCKCLLSHKVFLIFKKKICFVMLKTFNNINIDI